MGYDLYSDQYDEKLHERLTQEAVSQCSIDSVEDITSSMSFMYRHVEPAGVFRFSQPTWPKVLELARRGGWKPQGAIAPPKWDKEWDGAYDKNCGYVTDEDAKALALGLECAIQGSANMMDVSNEFLMRREPTDEDAVFMSFDSRLDASVLLGNKDTCDKLRRFATFCRRGGFKIL